jgi:GTPase SAR1 family protein
MYRLYSGIFYSNTQVVIRNFEQVRVDRVHLRIINILENRLTAEMWEPLTLGSVAYIFVLDVSMQEDYNKGCDFYQQIQSSKSLHNLPFIVYGNKIDLQNFNNESQLIKDLGLPIEERNKTYNVQAISCKTTEGITAGMDWLMKKTNTYFYIPAFRKIRTF